MNGKMWKLAIAFGLPCIIVMIVVHSIIEKGFTAQIAVSAIIGGTITGLMFAASMQYTARRLYKAIVIETNPDEERIKEGGANHFMGKEGVGGKLLLTDKRLIFKSHKFNIQNHQQVYDLRDIRLAQASMTVKIFRNGLNVELRDGVVHKFVVDQPNEWVVSIERQRLRDNR
jgi:hypothetical protein